MKLFISWSGETSRNLALLLREWLPQVVLAVKPFVSSEDIEKGARWSSEIAAELNDTSQGLVIVTRENQNSPWLNFEAGALSKFAGIARVRTLLWDLSNADIYGPLSVFQSTRINDAEDMQRMIRGLNDAADVPVTEGTIQKVFERSWPYLRDDLGTVKESSDVAEETVRPIEGMIEEILERIRELQRNASVEPMEAWERDLLYGASPDSLGGFKVGDSVTHKKLGRGVIQDKRNNGLMVDFAQSGPRYFSLGTGLNGLKVI
jgi:hypothetical protein